MTNGTSQGLFVVVAIIIFGIFVLISYLLFKDNLKPTLANIFTDGLKQGTCNLISECPIDIVAEREDETYLFAKIREADESKGETEIWVRAEKLEDGTLKIDRSSVSDNNYSSSGSAEMTGSLIMPDTINGMKIIGIGDGDKISLANSWLQNSVFTTALFDGTIRLPAYLTYISHTTFQRSKFSGTISIPKNVTIIGVAAFLTSTFEGEIELPSGLTAIGDYAFDNSKFSGELKLPRGLTRVGGFRDSNFSGELILPDGLNTIGLSAFTNSKFKGQLKLPDSLTTIKSLAFQYSNFEGEIILPDKLTNIGNNSFARSKFSGELKLPKGVKIDLSAFHNSAFSGTLDVSNVTSIQMGAFSSSKIDKVIRGEVEMSDGSSMTNTSGINPKSIKLANGNWYDGSNG